MDLGYIEKIAIIVGNTFVCVGVVIAIISLIADHKRRKKQATFEFYLSIYKNHIEPLNKKKELFSNGQDITVENDKVLFNQIEAYLSSMERFAVGIEEKIYDFKVFRKTVGASYTKEWFTIFERIIKRNYGNSYGENSYKELKKLVIRLRKEELFKIDPYIC